MLHFLFVLSLFLAAPDDGIGIDPNGGRAAASVGDHRCTIDPNGGVCVGSSLTGDRGAGLDPDGNR
jgi:hypothetical protein